MTAELGIQAIEHSQPERRSLWDTQASSLTGIRLCPSLPTSSGPAPVNLIPRKMSESIKYLLAMNRLHSFRLGGIVVGRNRVVFMSLSLSMSQVQWGTAVRRESIMIHVQVLDRVTRTWGLTAIVGQMLGPCGIGRRLKGPRPDRFPEFETKQRGPKNHGDEGGSRDSRTRVWDGHVALKLLPQLAAWKPWRTENGNIHRMSLFLVGGTRSW